LNPLSLFIDALRLASNDGDEVGGNNCRWDVIAPALKPITASCGITINPTKTFSTPIDFDYIAVVGDARRNDPDADEQKLDFLRKAARMRVPLIGLCTGTFALARAGLLKGRRCCVGWNLFRVMREEFPDVTPIGDQSFVVDRDRLTCAGGVTAAHLAAWLLEKHCGRAISKKALQLLFIDRALPPQAAQPQPPLLPAAANKHVRRAMLVIEQQLSEPIAIDEVARRINISQRQLTRVFEEEFAMGPRQFARNYRLRYGLWLLLHTDRPITDIAAECGFNDLSHFSREFRRKYSAPPSQVRNSISRSAWCSQLNSGVDSAVADDRAVNRRHRAFV
jgi:transcriptional regulator GlxA family with amidase domain